MLVTAKPTEAKMELLLSVRHFLHLHHGGQALNSTVYINSTSLSTDLAAIITHHFIQMFTFITVLLSIHSFYNMLILQSLCTPQNDMSQCLHTWNSSRRADRISAKWLPARCPSIPTTELSFGA